MSNSKPALRRTGRGLQVSRLHRSGPEPLRMLIVGGAALSEDGDGPATTMAEEIADQLATLTGRAIGIDLDVLWDLGPAAGAVTALTGWRVWPYDAVVVLVGVGGADSSRRQARSRARDVVAAEQVHEAHPEVAVVHVRPEGAETDGSARARVGAPDSVVASGDRLPRALAELLLERTGLVEVTTSTWRDREQDESERNLALQESGGLRNPLEQRLDQVVAMARSSFGVDGAMVNLLDSDRLWTIAADGAPTGQQPRHGTLCNETIRSSGTTAYGDTWTETRFDGNPIMHGPVPLRFYLAHPIESLDGYRIGTLCVYDRDPHDPADYDLSLLRDFALLVEGELHEATSAGSSPTASPPAAPARP